ncbi:MAG: hypothetical protein JSV00_05620 [bacterium]|nr:MAG: hypothetical protein JSV00_05620 [bacterium]
MLDRLVHLQETDERIVAFQKEEEKIPRDLEEKEHDLEDLQENRDKARAAQEELQKQVSELTREVEEVRDHQRRCQARGLAVKTQREYQAVQRESEIAKKRRSELEGQIKELLEEKNLLEESLLETESRIEDRLETLEKQRSDADQRLRRIRTEREDLEKTREVEASLIQPDLLAKYQKVFERYKGKGVVRVTSGVCNGCFMTIPPQLYNQVLAQGGIHQCPNCGRIIYVDRA